MGNNLSKSYISLDAMALMPTLSEQFTSAGLVFVHLVNFCDMNTKNIEIYLSDIRDMLKFNEIKDSNPESDLKVLSDFGLVSSSVDDNGLVTGSLNPNAVQTPDIKSNNYSGKEVPSFPLYVANPVIVDKEELKKGRMVILRRNSTPENMKLS
jgi:hypothetical protein